MSGTYALGRTDPCSTDAGFTKEEGVRAMTPRKTTWLNWLGFAIWLGGCAAPWWAPHKPTAVTVLAMLALWLIGAVLSYRKPPRK